MITGALTTRTPLHIGGDLPEPRDLYPKDDKKKKIENVMVTTVVTDCNERAYIPASTLKGNLRAWMKENGYDEKVIAVLFGSPHYEQKDLVGGRVEFCDCLAAEIIPSFSDAGRPPYWDKARLTGVTASVAIDRRTGTRADKKLFHEEYVPPGVCFDVVITGQDLDDGQVAALAHAIQTGFNPCAKNPITLGTAGCSEWGRLEWKPGKISKMTKADVLAWLKNPRPGYSMMEALPAYQLDCSGISSSQAIGGVKIELKLRFEGQFLIDDKSRSRKVTGEEHEADFNPRRDTNGNVILPVRSFRGALRSQAERIVRTIGGTACSPAKPCEAVRKKEDVEKKLCPACRLFGASGWRTTLHIQPFRLTSVKKDGFRQDFIAIDRFTGGGKDGAKFDALSAWNPIFEGSLRLDMDRIEPWGLGLLALTLRDLAEGDITFGFGASKGYGACRATVSWPAQIDHVGNIKAFEQRITGGK